MPRISLFKSEVDTTPTMVEVPWEKLVESLREVRYTKCQPCLGKDCPHKAGLAWSPAVYEPAKRLDANVVEITCAVLDIDNPTRENLQLTGAALEGFEYVMHQTHRGNGYRLVLPLAAPVPAAQWPAAWAALQAKFAPYAAADQTGKNLSRLYFAPSRPEGAGFEFYDGHGLEYDATPDGGVVAAQKVYHDAAVASASLTELAYDQGPIDREGLLNLSNLESREIMKRVFDGAPLAISGYRDVTVNRAASILAQFGPKAYAPELAISLLRPSIENMPVDPEGLEAWLDKARGSYQRALVRRAEREAKEKGFSDALDKVLGKGPNVPVSEAWRTGLLSVMKLDGEAGGLRQIGWNAFLILDNEASWKGTIRFNELTKDIEITGGPMAGQPAASLATYVSNWLAASEFKLYLSSQVVGEQLLAVARTHPFDPIQELLLPTKWDGVKRIDNFFRGYMNARGNEEHISKISRCFLISCIARAMKPGCEVQTVPILRGAQGCGKSRSIRALGQPFTMAMKIDAHNKDARVLAASAWIIELEELAGLRGADLEAVKGFISSPDDKLRPPYGKVPELFKRRSVFVGTTNKLEFLEDETGLRRWWPIEVGKCDVAGIARDRDQLFAEALVAYNAGEKWHLNDEEAAVAETEAGQFAVMSIREEQIVSWFNAKPIHERPVEMTSYDFAVRVFGCIDGQITGNLKQQVGYALSSLGFKRSRKWAGGKMLWYYQTPEEIMRAPRETKTRSTNLNVVPPEKKEG